MRFEAIISASGGYFNLVSCNKFFIILKLLPVCGEILKL